MTLSLLPWSSGENVVALLGCHPCTTRGCARPPTGGTIYMTAPTLQMHQHREGPRRKGALEQRQSNREAHPTGSWAEISCCERTKWDNGQAGLGSRGPTWSPCCGHTLRPTMMATHSQVRACCCPGVSSSEPGGQHSCSSTRGVKMSQNKTLSAAEEAASLTAAVCPPLAGQQSPPHTTDTREHARTRAENAVRCSGTAQQGPQ